MRIILIITLFLVASNGFCQKTVTLDQLLSRVPQITYFHSDSLNQIVSTQIKSSWFSLLFQIQKNQLLEEYQGFMNDLVRVTELRLQAGEIDYNESASLMGIIVDIEQSVAISENEVQMARIQLQRMLCTGEELIPQDSSLSIYEIEKGFSPDWELIFDADTVLSGKKAFDRGKNMEYKLLELDNIFIKIHYFKRYRLPYAETILDHAFARYQHEEIDYTELVRQVSESYQIRLDYLAEVNSYNQSALKLEIYANQ